MELNDWLDIILDYLKVLAWPAVVFALALVYRRPLIRVLERLKKASAPGVAFELNADSRELAGEAIAAAVEAALEAREASTTTATDPQTDATTDSAPEPTTASATEQQPTHTTDRAAGAGLMAIIRNAFDTGRADGALEGAERSPAELRQLRSWKTDWSEESRRAYNLRPIGAVWDVAKAEAERIGQLLDPPLKKPRITRVAEELVLRDLVIPGAVDLARGLESIRSRILHSPDAPTEETVANFTTTATVLIGLLRDAGDRLGHEMMTRRVTDRDDPATDTSS